MFARIAFVVTTTLLLGLAACGDDGPPDAAEIYADAGEAMAALTSYHVTGDGLDDGEAFTMELDLVLPDSFQASFTFSDANASLEINVISVDGEQYQRIADFSSDWFIVAENDRADFDGTAAFASALTTEISDLTYIGEEELDGTATYRLEGTLPREVIELIDSEGPLPESIAIELWVGTDDSLVRRYVLAPDEAEERTTFTLSQFDDETINIEAPPNPLTEEELELQIVQEIIADLSAEERECFIQELGAEVFAAIEAGERLPPEDDIAAEACFEE